MMREGNAPFSNLDSVVRSYIHTDISTIGSLCAIVSLTSIAALHIVRRAPGINFCCIAMAVVLPMGGRDGKDLFCSR